ncbi:unnamed protein product [Lota lota]
MGRLRGQQKDQVLRRGETDYDFDSSGVRPRPVGSRCIPDERERMGPALAKWALTNAPMDTFHADCPSDRTPIAA